MILHFTIAGRPCAVDSTAAVDLARPLDLSGAGPSWFGAPAPRLHPFRAGSFVGSTLAGGSCNVGVIELVPHCQGTHTESFGHLCDQAPPLTGILEESLLPASVIRVRPGRAAGSADTLPPTALGTDQVLDSGALRPRLATLAAGFHRALVIACDTPADGEDLPPYVTPEGIRLLLAAGVQHLVVELPSLDRLDDGGLLRAHRAFWGLGPGSREGAEGEARLRTVTELVVVPGSLIAGPGLLELGIAPLAGEAAPSRPRFYPLLPVIPSPREPR